METLDAASRAFAALAQETRVATLKALVAAGPGGLAAGEIAERLGAPPSTLSFHLKALAAADLVVARKDGRRVIYAADYGGLRRLVEFLLADCCQGDPRLCGPYVFSAGPCAPMATKPAHERELR